MSLGADFLLPKVSSVHADQNLRSSPKEAGQSGFSGILARAREGGEAVAGEEASSLGGHTQAANDQSSLAADEQAVAVLGNELPGSELPGSGLPGGELPPEEELTLAAEPEAVSLESLMLFGRDSAAPASDTPVAAAEAQAVDESAAAVLGADATASPDAQADIAEQTLAVADPMAPASAAASQTAGVAQAAASALGARQMQPTLAETRARQAALPELHLAKTETLSEALPEGGLAADDEQDFTELLRSSLSAAAGSSAQHAAEGPDSPVNPLTQAVQQASAAQREVAANALQQPLSMRQPGMSEAVVERVMWLSSQNLRSAEIQLDPAELGRLEIRISLNQEQTQISFASPHASVREALEGQMHRLREMFNQQGLGQFDVNVSDQSLARGERQADERGAYGLAGGGAEAEEGLEAESLIATTPLESGRGLVDFYA